MLATAVIVAGAAVAAIDVAVAFDSSEFVAAASYPSELAFA